MKKMKVACITFFIASVLLFGAMCATVAFCYARAICAMEHQFTSAPPEIAFLLLIPFVMGIAICVFLCAVFYKKYKGTS